MSRDSRRFVWVRLIPILHEFKHMYDGGRRYSRADSVPGEGSRESSCHTSDSMDRRAAKVPWEHYARSRGRSGRTELQSTSMSWYRDACRASSSVNILLADLDFWLQAAKESRDRYSAGRI